MLQEDVYRLLDRLVAAGKTVLLETGGHMSIERVPREVRRIVDVKCPGSGESEKNDRKNLERLMPHDEVKFVIRDRADYKFARNVLQEHHLDERVAAVLFSPVHGEMPARTLAEWILADALEVRLQIQLHKYMWAAKERGV